MIDELRFTAYRNIIATFLGLGFKSHEVVPLAAPVDTTIEHEPFEKVFPDLPLHGIHVATTFLPTDDAPKRNRKTKAQTKLRSLLEKVAPADTGPIKADERSFIADLYPSGFRKIWPTPPAVPPELRDTDDPIAALAVSGPFASYLTRDGDHYAIDLSDLLDYPVYDGLVRPGGKAVLRVGDDGKLHTESIERHDTLPRDLAERALLAGLNEEVTSFRHNLCMHSVMLTSVAIATINNLNARHPIRRLLQHCFHTLLVGNRENANAQLSGPMGFSVTLFSHDAEQVARIAEERIRTFDLFDFHPEEQFARRGTTTTTFDYPYRDNILEIWAATADYVQEYIGLYYDDDDAAGADPALQQWAAALDELLPNGAPRPDGRITRDWIARVCGTVIHVSTVEHDIVNNVVWNYTTLGWIVPTVVPASGAPMDRRRAFDMMAILMVTWRPFNMLLTSNVPGLAIDERGRKVMLAWIERLEEIQKRMQARGHDPSLAYPANLNVSITN